VFSHRLRRRDVDEILKALSATNREEMLSKVGEVLRRISALLDVHHKVSDTLSLDVMLARLIEIIADALDAERGTLFLLDPSTKELYSRVAIGDLVREIRIPSDSGIAGAVFSGGQPIIIHDAYSDPRFNPEVDQQTGSRTRSILCAPLIDRFGRRLGVSQVLNKRRGRFVQEDSGLLQAITAQAAGAIEKAQLHERVEKARREEAQMIEVTGAISTELQLDPLLRKIMAVTTEILDADRSTLLLFDEATDELWSRVAEGEGIKEIRFPAWAGIAGSCFKGRKPVNIPDAYADPRFNPEVDRRTGYRTRNILCMPLLNKSGAAIGVTQVLNKRGGPFEDADEARLRAFSSQAVIAIEDARLFEDVLNARNYSESILKSLSNGVVTLSASRGVIKVNPAAQKILRVALPDVVDKPVSMLFADENAWVLASIAKVAETGAVDIAMDTGIRFGREEVAVNLTTVPLIDIRE